VGNNRSARALTDVVTIGNSGNVAILISAYAAVVSTAALAVSWYVALRDRADLEVIAGPDDPARRDIRAPHDTDPRFLVHVRNRGPRSISIDRIWFTRRSTGKVRSVNFFHRLAIEMKS
jgi:hypothetical protein